MKFTFQVAAEFQRKDFKMWISDDILDFNQMEEVDLGEGVKPPG